MKVFLLLLFFLICLRHISVSQDSSNIKTCSFYFNKELKKKVFVNSLTPPEFPGGSLALMRFSIKHLRIPQEVLDEEQASVPMVMMTFVVDTDGELRAIKLNGKSDTASFEPMELEVMRILRLMPKWEPGICNGKKVPVEVKRPFANCLYLERE